MVILGVPLVQAVRLGRVGPPVIAVGVEIVRAALAERGPELGDRDGSGIESFLGQRENRRAVEGAYRFTRSLPAAW